jgi:hypothetical protein
MLAECAKKKLLENYPNAKLHTQDKVKQEDETCAPKEDSLIAIIADLVIKYSDAVTMQVMSKLITVFRPGSGVFETTGSCGGAVEFLAQLLEQEKFELRTYIDMFAQEERNVSGNAAASSSGTSTSKASSPAPPILPLAPKARAAKKEGSQRRRGTSCPDTLPAPAPVKEERPNRPPGMPPMMPPPGRSRSPISPPRSRSPSRPTNAKPAKPKSVKSLREEFASKRRVHSDRILDRSPSLGDTSHCSERVPPGKADNVPAGLDKGCDWGGPTSGDDKDRHLLADPQRDDKHHRNRSPLPSDKELREANPLRAQCKECI